jgi:hypothetical protein
MESSMLAKIISALALTLLLTGGASAFIPQQQESLQTEPSVTEPSQQQESLQTEPSVTEPSQQQESLQTELSVTERHNIYAGHSNSAEPQENSETQLFAGDTAPSHPQPHDIYAGHSNSAQAQENLEAQLFAADIILSEPRQFD